MKLLHAADFHLDAAFSALPPEKAVQRRREQRLALEQLKEVCRGCDVVLLAGDLFDSAQVYRESIDALKDFFASVEAQIFIAPGNHDAYCGGSPYATENWGENVHIFTSPAIECVRLEHLNCNVYGAAFTAQEMPPLLEGFSVDDPNAINLLVMHGDVRPQSPYNRISAENIGRSKLDYAALGHIHAAEVAQVGQTAVVYPGCLMGRGFDECGQKGVYRAEVTKSGVKTEFVPIFTRKYMVLTVEATDDPLAAIEAALPKNTAEDCCRIVLRGESDGVNTDALEGALCERFFSLTVRDKTVPKRALWASAGEDTLRGHTLNILKEIYDGETGPQQRRAAMAAKLVSDLMDGREVVL